MKDVSILIEAKKRYIEQLQQILTPRIYEGFESIYDNSLELLENEFEEKNQQSKSIAKVFQEALKEIPLWNQDIIEHECIRIIKVSNCDYLEDLIEAIFIAESKILTSVQKYRGKTQVHVPRASHFIHRCYISSAREIYKNPYVFNHSKDIVPQERHNNMRYTIHMIEDGISNAIRELLPIRDILKQGFFKDLGESDGSNTDSEMEIDYSDEERNHRSKSKHKHHHHKSRDEEESDESSKDSTSGSDTESDIDESESEHEVEEKEEEFQPKEEIEPIQEPLPIEIKEEEEVVVMEEPQEMNIIEPIQEKPSLFQGMMNQMSHVFTSKPSNPIHFDDDEEKEEEEVESGKEPLFISFDDDDVPQKIPYVEEEIRQIHLDGAKIPKEYRNREEIKPEEPSSPSQESSYSIPISLSMRDTTSNSTINQNHIEEVIKKEDMVEEDRRSIASSGILYRKEPKKTKEELYAMEKQKRREKDVKIRKPVHYPVSTRDNLYEKSMMNYKKFHSDNESIASGRTTTSSNQMNGMSSQMVSYLENQRKMNQPQISYVPRPVVVVKKEEKMESGDEYESDRELSQV
jgi:hypothetical protein